MLRSRHTSQLQVTGRPGCPQLRAEQSGVLEPVAMLLDASPSVLPMVRAKLPTVQASRPPATAALQRQLPTGRPTLEPVTASLPLREDRGQEVSSSVPRPSAPPPWRTGIPGSEGSRAAPHIPLRRCPPVRAGECVTRPLEGMLLGQRLDKATLKLLATRAPAYTVLGPSCRPLLPSISRGPPAPCSLWPFLEAS